MTFIKYLCDIYVCLALIRKKTFYIQEKGKFHVNYFSFTIKDAPPVGESGENVIIL